METQEGSSSEKSGCKLKAYAKIAPETQDGDIPVMVGITPLSGTAEQRVPLDLVLLLHVHKEGNVPKNWGELLKKAVDVIVQKLDDEDRLAVLPLQSSLRARTSCNADSANVLLLGDLRDIRSSTSLVSALESAESILYVREPMDKERRAGHIIVISNSNDDTDSLLPWKFCSVHAFGFRDAHNAGTMSSISRSRGSTYALLDDEHGGITRAFLACVDAITSTVLTTPMEIKLKCEQEVLLSAIDAPGIRYFISNDQNLGIVWPSPHIIAGLTTNFVVYLRNLQHGDLITKLFTLHVKYGHGNVPRKIDIQVVKKGMDGSKELAEAIVRIKAIKIVSEITREVQNGWEQLHANASNLSDQWTKLESSDCGKEAAEHGLISRLSAEMREMEIRLYNSYYWLEYMLTWQSHKRCQLPLPHLFMYNQSMDEPLIPLIKILGKVPRIITGNQTHVPLLVQLMTPEAGLAKVKRASVDLVAVLDISYGAQEIERKTQKRLNLLLKAKEKAEEHGKAKKMLEKPLEEYNKADKLVNKAEELLKKTDEMLEELQTTTEPEKKKLLAKAEKERALLAKAEKERQELLDKAEEPRKKLQEPLDKAKEHREKIQELLDKALNLKHQEKMQELLNKALEHWEKRQELLDKAMEPYKKMQELLDKAEEHKKNRMDTLIDLKKTEEDLKRKLEEHQEAEKKINQKLLEARITLQRLGLKSKAEHVPRKEVKTMEEQITQRRLEVESMEEQIALKRLEVKSMKEQIVQKQSGISSIANEMNSLHTEAMETEQDLKRVMENTQRRLELLIKAMDLVTKKLSDKDRLAIISVPFSLTEPTTGLLKMSEHGRSETSTKMKSLVDLIVRKLIMASANKEDAQTSRRGKQLKEVKNRLPVATNSYIPSRTPAERQGTASMSTHSADVGSCKLGKALMDATKMLEDRQGEEKDRMGFIIVISDSDDDSICMETLTANYTTHAFGFQDTHNTRALYHIARSSNGIYDILNDHRDRITSAFMDCINKITTIIAVDIKVDIKCNDTSRATLYKIDSGRYKKSIDNGGKSCSILVDALCVGVARDLIVHMDNVRKEDYDCLSKVLTVHVRWLDAMSRMEEKLDCQVVVVGSKDDESIYKELSKDWAYAHAVKIARVITDPSYDNRITQDKLQKMREECFRYAQVAGEDRLAKEMRKMDSILREMIHDNRYYKSMLANKLSYMFAWLSYHGSSEQAPWLHE
ncbi:hypothetical protein ACP4OV_029063 [Aristida adscensionis]